jgi:site-specific recombinase XerD
LRFFYGVTLGQKEAFERIIFGREPEKLPAVLNAEEVVRFLEAVEGLRNRIALTTAYAAGLRVREVTRLRIASIDSTRMLIHIEMGKGGRNDTPCCRRAFSTFSAPIGGERDQVSGCSKARNPAIM